MKRLICCLAITLSVIYSYAQKIYFVYLQSDPEQEFYVRVKDNVYSSSASGYLILSRLKDSSYSFTVGFPQNKWPEQQYKVDIRSKDHGYLLKNFGEKGWGLYDLQTLAVQMGLGDEDKTIRQENKDISAFTDVLAKAANDPSLREKAVKKEEPKIVPQQAVVKTEEAPPANNPVMTTNKENGTVPATEKKADINNAALTKKEEMPAGNQGVTEKKEEEKEKQAVVEKKLDSMAADNAIASTEKTDVQKTEVPKSDPPKTELPKAELPKADPPKAEVVSEPLATVYKPSVVKRRSESSTSEGFGLTFVDEYPDGKTDTIRILIPNPRVKAGLKEKEEPKQDVKFLDITADSKDVTNEPKTSGNKEERIRSTAGCTAQATEDDFLKLRKRMAGAAGDDKMVSEAMKTFKTKCFAVSQLKNLSTLFLNDAGKYKFFDAAYPRVYDPANFSQLQAELKDEYYINRFKAMLR